MGKTLKFLLIIVAILGSSAVAFQFGVDAGKKQSKAKLVDCIFSYNQLKQKLH